MSCNLEDVLNICRIMTDNEIILEENIRIVRRPLYWEKYCFTVGLSPTAKYWQNFIELKSLLLKRKDHNDFLQSNSKTIDFWLFSNKPKLLLRLMTIEEFFFFNHVNIVSSDSWHLKLPKPKKKTKWYGEFGWRVEFSNKKWLLDNDNLQRLEILADQYKISTFPGSFLYLKSLGDTIAIKLMWAEHIRNIEDRSDL